MLRPVRLAGLVWLAACSFLASSVVAPAPAQAGRKRPAPVLTITSPVNGTFVNDTTVTVTGQVTNLPSGTTVTVNGTPVTVQADGTFSQVVTLNPTIVFNPIETLVWVDTNPPHDRRVVIAGPSVADGDFSLDSVALRLNDSGLDELEPVVTNLVNLDLATLVPPGTQVIDEYCVATFIVCIQTADAYIDSPPPPSIGSYSINVDSQQDYAFGDILLNDLFLKVKVVNGSIGLLPFTCYVTITAATTDIQGDFALEPLASDPQYVDVQQVGGAHVVFGGFNNSTDCAGIFGDVLEFFMNLLIGDIQGLMTTSFTNFLNTQDAAGNTPVAGAIEQALAGIHIAGPIGDGLGVHLDAPLFEVAEDPDGITLGADARVLSEVGTGPGQCSPPPGSPDLPASYRVDETFPALGATTPVGGLPYDLGISISTSAFNQLLKAQTECGLLQDQIRDVVVGGTTVRLTSSVLSLFLQEFSTIGDVPLVAVLQPTTAPLLTGSNGAHGEMEQLRIGQLLVDIQRDDPSLPFKSYLKIAVDFPIGLNFDFDTSAGALLPILSTLAASDVTVGLISTAFPSITLADVQKAVPGVLVQALPALSGTLGSFPIPAFFGFALSPVELGRTNGFLTVYADLAPTP